MDMMELKEFNVLLCCTGSVATIKLPEMIEQIEQLQYEFNKLIIINLNVVMTKHAFHFVPDLPHKPNIRYYSDDDEWISWEKRGDPVLHIELSKWCDIIVIAPLDANTLAKVATGLCDNLLTCILRAWDFNKPILFCPAMNTKMWQHPITKSHINTLKGWGYEEIPCVSKTLMCGDTGLGAMAEVETIKVEIRKRIQRVITSL
uniref:Phosphopantothenoylcysteine decarboxylase n=2 Tax=Cacopsylla melanoneura TaxID=428564 RepID=A0A8D8RW68_9HEMI